MQSDSIYIQEMDSIWVVAIVAVLLPIVAALVFRRVGQDYDRQGQLTRFATSLEILVFALHGVSSYVFLDSRLSVIDRTDPLVGFSVVLIIGGLILLFSTMGHMGHKTTLGQETQELTCTRMYRHSRNPQILFYGFVVVGYSLLWPSWTGVLWVVLYAVIAHMMVRTEEKHLQSTYGEAYVEYCRITPRYIGTKGRK